MAKLCYKKNNTEYTCDLATTANGGGWFACQYGPTTYYAKLVPTNDPIASDIHVWANGEKAIAKSLPFDLYVFGNYTVVGGLTTNDIAKWNGSSWSALGLGTADGEIYAGTFDSLGNLFVVGTFTTIGGVSANRVAKWDGSSWSALGSGLGDNSCQCIARDSQNNIYVGGDFTTAGGSSIQGIAKWNGASWSSLAGSIGGGTGSVSAICIDGSDNVYAGGYFPSPRTIGGITAANIAKWNGTSWTALAYQMGSGTPKRLSLDTSNNLVMGGTFTQINWLSRTGVSIWNGSDWVAMPGLSNNVNAMGISPSGTIYCWSNGIKSWNGSTWTTISSDYATDIKFAPNGDLYYGTSGGIKYWNGLSSFSFATCTGYERSLLIVAK